jgi:hypothetical protein
MTSGDATTMWKKQKVENGSGTLFVHLLTSLLRNLFLEFVA